VGNLIEIEKRSAWRGVFGKKFIGRKFFAFPDNTPDHQDYPSAFEFADRHHGLDRFQNHLKSDSKPDSKRFYPFGLPVSFRVSIEYQPAGFFVFVVKKTSRR
jgi:hypothetical protein